MNRVLSPYRLGNRSRSPEPTADRLPVRIAHWLELWWHEVGGPLRSATNLARAMSQRGHSVRFGTADPRDAPSEWMADEPPRLIVAPTGPLGLLGHASKERVRELLSKTDVLHLHGLWERSTAQVAGLARDAGVPYIVSLRGMLDREGMAHHSIRKRLYFAAVAGRLVRGAAAIHCTALGESEQAEPWLGGRKPEVIPNLLAIDPLLSLDRHESPKAEILHLGRVHPSKGVDLLMHAVAALRDRGLDIHLHVAGSGQASHVEALRRLVSELDLAAGVTLHGHVDDALRDRLLARVWMLAAPSEKENFGNAIFESLAAAVPVVVSRGLDAEDLFRASGGALLVDRSIESFAASIERLVHDREARRSMGELGREWASRNLAPAVVADRFEALYRRVTASR